MEGSVKDLSMYRFESAGDDLESARLLLKDGKFKASVNRSYYEIFHALRSGSVKKQTIRILLLFQKNRRKSS